MNEFFKSISTLHQRALFPPAESLDESETLFILSQNLLETKWPSSLIWKRTQLNKKKSCHHPLHLKEYLVICTEVEWILHQQDLLLDISSQVIMEAVKWLFASPAVNLTERLKVFQRLLCWTFCYYEDCDKTLPHFLSCQDEGRKLSALTYFGFLWPEINQMRRPLKPASDSQVYWMWPYQWSLCSLSMRYVFTLIMCSNEDHCVK